MQIKNMEEKIDSLVVKIDNLIDKIDNKYADREQFIFWPNLLISGILLAIFLSTVIGAITLSSK
jgi:hypothetical protein